MRTLPEGIFLYACETGSLDNAERAIKRGVDINVTNNDNRSGLILAAIGKHHDIISLLIRSGADVNIKDDYGNTADNYSRNTDKFPSRRKPLKSEVISQSNMDYLESMDMMSKTVQTVIEVANHVVNNPELSKHHQTKSI